MYGKLHMSKRMNYIQDAALFCSKFTHLCEKFMALGLGGKTPLCGLFYIDYCGQSLVPSRAVFVKFHWGGSKFWLLKSTTVLMHDKIESEGNYAVHCSIHYNIV